MNQTTRTSLQEAPSQLMGVLGIMGCAALNNLRDVAQALGRHNFAGLSRVVERNAKQTRLRAEIEEQVVGEMFRMSVGTRDGRKLILTSQAALMFERMGARTVELSELCRLIIRDPRPSRTTEIKKLIEHAVFIADKAATALVKEDLMTAKAALEQKRAAVELNVRIRLHLASPAANGEDGAVRASLPDQIACKTYGIIEDAGQLASDIIIFLEKAEL
jgi:phosphate uptake regulator